MKFENISIGVDLEEVQRFEKFTDKNDPFVKKIFTKAEIEYSYKDKNFAAHLAARYCAKEACVKALHSLGIGGYFCRDFEVLNNEKGVPEVFIVKEKRGDNISFKLSLSHTKNYATATVLAFVN